MHDAEPAGNGALQAEGSVHVAEPAGEEQNVRKHVYGPAQGYSGRYRDDLTGQPLRDDLVKAARAKEPEFFTSKGVWSKAPRQRAFARTGKPPISLRWVDLNKGDEDEQVVLRSRPAAGIPPHRYQYGHDYSRQSSSDIRPWVTIQDADQFCGREESLLQRQNRSRSITLFCGNTSRRPRCRRTVRGATSSYVWHKACG